MIRELNNRDDLKNEELVRDYIATLFYNETSKKSKEALSLLNEIKKKNKDVPIFAVNASKVRDIHPEFGINSVPALMILKKGEIAKLVYGLQTKDYYEMLFSSETNPHTFKKSSQKSIPRVIVYSTPSCPWCTRVKNYLRKNGIGFRDINVASDLRAAEDMVRKSGERGVPQIDINGQIIIGFDQSKIDKLLNIKN